MINNSSQKASLSIIIISYNTRALLLGCLKNLNSAEPEHPFEIIVADNDSHDGTAAAVKKDFPGVILIQNGSNLGFGAAVNRAVRQAGGRYLMILNPDTVVVPATIDKMLDYLEDCEDDRVVGCRLRNGDGSLQLSCSRFPTPLRIFSLFSRLDVLLRGEKFQMYYEKLSLRGHKIVCPFHGLTPRMVDTVLGACFIIPRQLFEKAGGFDERYFMHYEEVDLFRSLQELGAGVYFLPGLVVTHYGAQSTAQDYVKMRLEQQRSLLLYLSKWHGPKAAQFIKAEFIIFGLLRLAGLFTVRVFRSGNRDKADEQYRAARMLLSNLVK